MKSFFQYIFIIIFTTQQVSATTAGIYNDHASMEHLDHNSLSNLLVPKATPAIPRRIPSQKRRARSWLLGGITVTAAGVAVVYFWDSMTRSGSKSNIPDNLDVPAPRASIAQDLRTPDRILQEIQEVSASKNHPPPTTTNVLSINSHIAQLSKIKRFSLTLAHYPWWLDEPKPIAEHDYADFEQAQLKTLVSGQLLQFNEDLGAHDFTILDRHMATNQSPSQVLYQIWSELKGKNLCGFPNHQYNQSLRALQSCHSYTNFALMIHLMQSHQSDLAMILIQSKVLPKAHLNSITTEQYREIVSKTRHALATLVDKNPDLKKCIPLINSFGPYNHNLPQALQSIGELIMHRPLKNSALEAPLTLQIDKIDNHNLQDFQLAFTGSLLFAPKLLHLTIKGIELTAENWSLFWRLFQSNNFSHLKSLSLSFLSSPTLHSYYHLKLPKLNSLTLIGTEQATLSSTFLYSLKESLKDIPLLKKLSIDHPQMPEEDLKKFLQSLTQRISKPYSMFRTINPELPAKQLHVEIKNHRLLPLPHGTRSKLRYKNPLNLPPIPPNTNPVFNPIQHNLGTCLAATAANHSLESCPYVCSSGYAICAEQISKAHLQAFIQDFEKIDFWARMTGFYEGLFPKPKQSEHNVLGIIKHFLQTDSLHSCDTCKDISQYVDALRDKISNFYTTSLRAHRLIVDAQTHNNPRVCMGHSEIDKKQCPWHTETALQDLHNFGSTPNLPPDIRSHITRTVEYFASHLQHHPYDLCQPHVEKMLHNGKKSMLSHMLMRHDDATCPHMQHPSFAYCAEKAQTDPEHVSNCPYLSINIGARQYHNFGNLLHQPGLCQHYHKGYTCCVNPENPRATAAFGVSELIDLFQSGILLTGDNSINLPTPSHGKPVPAQSNNQPTNLLSQPQRAPLNPVTYSADLIGNGVSNLMAINPAVASLIRYPEVTQALKLNPTLSEFPTHTQSSATALTYIKSYIMLDNLLRGSEPLKELADDPHLLLALTLDCNLPKALTTPHAYALLTNIGRLLYDSLVSTNPSFRPRSYSPLMRSALQGAQSLQKLQKVNSVQFNLLTTRLLPIYQDHATYGLQTIFNPELPLTIAIANHLTRFKQWIERHRIDQHLLLTDSADPVAYIKQLGAASKKYLEESRESLLTIIGLNSPHNTKLLMKALPNVVRRKLPIECQTFQINDGQFLGLCNTSVIQQLVRSLAPSAQKDLQHLIETYKITEYAWQSPYQSALSLAVLMLTNITGMLPLPEILLGLQFAPFVNGALVSQETHNKLITANLRNSDLQLITWQAIRKAADSLPLLHKAPSYWFWSFHPYSMGLVAADHALNSPVGTSIKPLALAMTKAALRLTFIAESYIALEYFYHSLWQNKETVSAALYGQHVSLNPYKPAVDKFLLAYPYLSTLLAINALRPLLGPCIETVSPLAASIWQSLPLGLQIELGLFATAFAYYHRNVEIPGFNQATRWYQQGFAGTVKSNSLKYYKAYPKLTLGILLAAERILCGNWLTLLVAKGAGEMNLTPTDMGVLLFSVSPWLSLCLKRPIHSIAETYSFKSPMKIGVPDSARYAAQLLKRAQANLSLDCYLQYKIISLALYTGLILPQAASLTPPTAFTAWLWSSVIASEIARDPYLQPYEHLQPLVAFLSSYALNNISYFLLENIAPYPALYTPAVGIAAISAAQKIKQLDVDWQRLGNTAIQALESLPSALEINRYAISCLDTCAKAFASISLPDWEQLQLFPGPQPIVFAQQPPANSQKDFALSVGKDFLETSMQGLRNTAQTLHKNLESYKASLNNVPLTKEEQHALLECKNIISAVVTRVNKLQQLRQDFKDSCNKVQPKPDQRGFLARGLVYLAKSLIGGKTHHSLKN